MRLDKFVCKSTELTRSQAIQRINDGAVRVNGAVVINEAVQVHENNEITLDSKILETRPFRYIVLHKPAGTICSNIDEVYPSLFNCLDVNNKAELHIAGRLDADTTGMVLITDDGRWSYNITLPTKQCCKVYRVGLSKPISQEAIDKLTHGVLLQGECNSTRPAQVTVVNAKEVLLTITEGKFHQVKRMFSNVGNRVVSLHRESIGDIELDVTLGQWRYLSDEEVASFGE